jgi:hypothetical protein
MATKKITGQQLVEVRSGLSVLKEKRLPTSEAESMVFSMWYLLKPAFDAYDDIVKKLQAIQTEMQECEDEEEKKALSTELRQKAEGLTAQLFEVSLPKTKIQPSHLPKAHKGKDGEENPTGNAAIMIALGPDFFDMPNIILSEDE